MTKLKEIWSGIKSKIKHILIVLGIIGVATAATIVSLPPQVSNVAVEKVQQIYEQSVEIKANYQLDGALLKREAKSDPRDRIVVEVGNKDEFEPSIKISRWDEVDFKIIPDLTGVATKDKNLTFEGDKIKFGTPKIDYEMYEYTEGEGGYKYIWYLKSKPATNKVEFTIQSKGLNFYYQPELTQEEKDRGCVRPENVVGSYAVYMTNPGTNWVGGKEYKTGKVGHIYKPHLYDSNGLEAWGDLHIENGIYSVEIPQDFLDKAVYPIKSNDTFGYTTEGSSSERLAASSDNHIVGYKFSLGVNADLISISMYIKGYSATTKTRGGIYSTALAKQYETDQDNLDYGGWTLHWNTANILSPSTLSAGTYWLVGLGIGLGESGILIMYDSGTADYGAYSIEVNTLTDLPATWSQDVTNNHKHSIYATYELPALTVTTQAVSDITSITATGNGNITGSSENADKRGFVWDESTQSEPAESITVEDSESFEDEGDADKTFAGDWTNASGDDLDWQAETGLTGSSNTGPGSGGGTEDYDGNVFIYIEASGAASENDEAILEYGGTFPSNDTGCVTFGWNLYGSSMGSLFLEGWDGDSWETIWTELGDQGDVWHDESQNFSLVTYSDIRFRGVRGSGFNSDMAIDLIKVIDMIPVPAPADSDYSYYSEEEGDYGTGAFTGSLTSLSPSTAYYVRAWAWQATDEYVYGGEVNFETVAGEEEEAVAPIPQVISY